MRDIKRQEDHEAVDVLCTTRVQGIFNITGSRRERRRHQERALKTSLLRLKDSNGLGATIPDLKKAQCDKPNKAAQHSKDPPHCGEAP